MIIIRTSGTGKSIIEWYFIYKLRTQWIHNTHALGPSLTTSNATISISLTWEGGALVAIGGKVVSLPIPLGTMDFGVHHIHAFTIHVTILILLKGVYLHVVLVLYYHI